MVEIAPSADGVLSYCYNQECGEEDEGTKGKDIWKKGCED